MSPRKELVPKGTNGWRKSCGVFVVGQWHGKAISTGSVG